MKNTAREFFTAECPIAEVRRLMETETAFDDKLWKKFAEQGWTGIIFPEKYDGFGMGLVEMAVAMEEMGRALIPGPFISTVLVAGTILEKAGSEEQKKKYLGAICRGEAKSTLALLEKSASWDPEAVKLEARKAADGYALTGEKLFVADAERRGLHSRGRARGRRTGGSDRPRECQGNHHHPDARHRSHAQTLQRDIRQRIGTRRKPVAQSQSKRSKQRTT